MEQNQRGQEVYDFRRHDHIWQRVAPGLEPYPVAEMAAPVGTEQAMMGQMPPNSSGVQMPTLRQESQLPGAMEDPCCMGSAAAEMLEVLTGFIEEELEDQRGFLVLSRQAPAWARQRLRDMAAEEGEHARRLLAVYYLIQGTCYRPAVPCMPIRVGQWCDELRQRYHGAACNGLNYARAAEGTTDPCLTRLLEDLSTAEYRQADRLLAMLERSLG